MNIEQQKNNRKKGKGKKKKIFAWVATDQIIEKMDRLTVKKLKMGLRITL